MKTECRSAWMDNVSQDEVVMSYGIATSSDEDASWISYIDRDTPLNTQCRENKFLDRPSRENSPPESELFLKRDYHTD
jgi:hypothetical protein